DLLDENLLESRRGQLKPADAQLADRRFEDLLRISTVDKAQLRAIRDDRCALDLRKLIEKLAVSLVIDVQCVLAERIANGIESAGKNNLPFVHEDDLVRHPLRLGHHMRGEQDGPPLILQFAKKVADEEHVDGIESR